MKRFFPHLLVASGMLLFYSSSIPSALNNAFLDLRFSLSERPASGQLAVVAIDAPSLASVGVWPWPRRLHADLVDSLLRAGVSDIAFDVDLGAASQPDQDQAFEDALRRANGLVALPTFRQSTTNSPDKLYTSEPLPRFAAHAWSASVNIVPDADGIVRRYAIAEPLLSGLTPSLAALLAGRQLVQDNSFVVDFGIRTNTIPVYSFTEVLNNDKLRSSLQDKKVLVGATAVELGDRVTVPRGRIIPGVMLQALAAESLLRGRDLRTAEPWIGFLAALLLGLLIACLHRRWSAARIAAVIISTLIGVEAAALLLHRFAAILVDTAPLTLTLLLIAVVLGFEEINVRGLLRRIAERRFDRVAMSIADGLICADGSGHITLWNPAAEAMFGFTPQEIIGAPVSKVLCSLDGRPWAPLDVLSEQAMKIESSTQEFRGIRKDQTSFLVEASVSAWETAKGLNFSIAARDVSVRKREEERIRYLAEHDSLTGLLNRLSFIQEIKAGLGGAKAKGAELAVLLLDLDRFKEINDTMGHSSGDQVLRQAALRIEEAARGKAKVARLGGDEFAVLIDAGDARRLADEVSRAIIASFGRHDILLFGAAQNVSASIGIAVYPGRSDSPEQLMADADLAMYQAKVAGGGQIVHFDQTMRDAFEKRVALSDELQQAFSNKEFELYFQPQLDLRSNEVVGAEALIRWNHPIHGMVAPGSFIPLLNTLSISNDVSLWVMRSACQQARQWQLQGREIRVSINLSPAQFRTMDLAGMTASILAETGLPARLLELEVTEDIVIEDDAAALATFRRLSALGVRLAWDDFGTGYGSLTYLKKFPLDRLKIDQSFVRNLRKETDDFAIVEYTIRLSRTLGLSVTAEGIETQEVADLLTQLGCDEGQGFLFSPAIPADHFFTLAEASRSQRAA